MTITISVADEKDADALMFCQFQTFALAATSPRTSAFVEMLRPGPLTPENIHFQRTGALVGRLVRRGSVPHARIGIIFLLTRRWPEGIDIFRAHVLVSVCPRLALFPVLGSFSYFFLSNPNSARQNAVIEL